MNFTAFSTLSEEAQELIVSAVVGDFKDTGPPEMPDTVRAEIAAWAKIDEGSNSKDSE